MDNQTPIVDNQEIKLFVILATTLLILLVAYFIFGISKRDSSTVSDVASRAFPEVNLTAKSAYVYDIRTKTVLFAKNENTRMSLASLTKVMSALVADDLSSPEGTITINQDALTAEGDSGLYRDERWLLKDILDFSLLSSSNDGIRAVALSLGALSSATASQEEIINDFVREMNKKAGEIGLMNTYFRNETGLDESEVRGGAYGTARDMSSLMQYILEHKPELLSATSEPNGVFASIDERLHTAKNTNSITNQIPGLIASKTGATDTAGGNLVIVFDPELGRPIVVSVLGSTEKGRFADVEALVGASMEYIANN